LPDEKHKLSDVLRNSGVAGYGIVKAFEPDEDVDIWLCHRARLPNRRHQLWSVRIWRRSVAL